MIDDTTNMRWVPNDPKLWSERALGANVFLQSTGGITRAIVPADYHHPQIAVQGYVRGRMLVEAYVNGALKYERLYTDSPLLMELDLERGQGDGPCQLDIHFIPAAWGQVSLLRHVRAHHDHQMRHDVFETLEVA